MGPLLTATGEPAPGQRAAEASLEEGGAGGQRAAGTQSLPCGAERRTDGEMATAGLRTEEADGSVSRVLGSVSDEAAQSERRGSDGGEAANPYRHREDSGYGVDPERDRAASGEWRPAAGLVRQPSGTDSGKQSADEDEVSDAEPRPSGAASESESEFCCCARPASGDDSEEPEASGRRRRLEELGTSVESCYSACDYYAADDEGDGSMMDSMYSTASDRTLVGACACQRPADCRCALPPVSSDSEEEHEDEHEEGAVSVSDLSDKMRQLIRRVSMDLSAQRLQPDMAGSFHASSRQRQETLFESLGGVQPCQVGNSELTKTYDTKAVLGVAFQQGRQMRRSSDASTATSEDYRRFARFSECESELSEVSASGSGSCRSLSDLDSSLDAVSDDYLLEAVGGRLPRLISMSSAHSDSSIEVLDLETTGDFPRDFRFLPEPADKLRHVSGDSVATQATVVREEELDHIEEIEVLSENDDEPPPAVGQVGLVAAGKRGLLGRFLDMTADLLVGMPRELAEGGVAPGAGRRPVARSQSTVDRRPAVDDDEARRPRAFSVLTPRATRCRRCLKSRCPSDEGEPPPDGRRRSLDEPLVPDNAEREGKSQSVETATSQRRAGPGPGSAAGVATAAGTGMAQRSLDSAWPPSLSRGSSTTSQSEKVENPPKLVKYTVQERDTLTSIAARFDCLPTEVMKANRLGARLVFPGQVLLVPSRLPDAGDQPPADGSATGGGGGVGGVGGGGGGGAAAAAVPDDGGGQRSRASTKDSVDDLELDKDCLMKYVKIKTRHITDGQGVVTGTLLVTPNCLMFDPNVSDPLVLEHGADKYCVMVPMDYIVSAALYTDIAHMKVKDRGNIPLPDLPLPEVYHAPPKGTTPSGGGPVPAATPAESTTAAEPEQGAPTADAAAEKPAEPQEPAREQAQEAVQESAQELPQESAQEPAQEPQEPAEAPQEPALQEDPPKEQEEPTKDDAPLAKELTFPELSLRGGGLSVDEEETDPERSDASAFPKAFERDLVTPEARREATLGDGDGDGDGNGDGAPSAAPAAAAPPSAPPAKDTMTDSAISLGGEPAETRAVQFSQRDEPPGDEFDETKKQKVWKRLSHPLTWMESLSGTQEREPTPSSAPPHLENTPKSMLSNVVSSVSSVSSAIVSSPRYIVDLGSGLLSSLSPGDAELATPPAVAPAQDSGAASRTASVCEEDARREGNSVFYSERSSVDRKPRAQTSFGGYKNLVSMDERPSLFTSFDELIPKPSTRAEDPPLYLCLIMGKRKGRKIRKTVRIVSYGEEKLRSEFWFSIPRDKCDQLYHFIQYWAPEIYGSLETTKPEERGFELVDSDTDIWEADDGWEASASDAAQGESGLMDLPRQLPKQSWEMGGMSEELRRALCSNSMTSMDMEFVPDLIGKSELLTDEIRKSLCKKIPPRVEGHPWSLIFSSSEHGFSLKSLYRKTSAYECPMILFVQDTNDHIFGALCSTTIHMSEHYYGTGETFLFTFYEKFRTYGWSGENLYFARGSPDGLEFGSGDGHYGLYLDGDLYRGRTQPCLTYKNEPLTSSQDFIVRAVELWALT